MPSEQMSQDLGEVATGTDFVRELQSLRERSGLTIREVARAAGTSVSTTGDYFSGRHLPLDREQFARILAACGETSAERVEAWQAALARVRRSPGRRGEPPYRGLARFEAARRTVVLRPRGLHRADRVPRRAALRPAADAGRRVGGREVVAAAGGAAAPAARGRGGSGAGQRRARRDLRPHGHRDGRARSAGHRGGLRVLRAFRVVGPVRRVGFRRRARRSRADRGPVRGPVHAVPGRGRAERADLRAVRSRERPGSWCSRCAPTSTVRRSAIPGCCARSRSGMCCSRR